MNENKLRNFYAFRCFAKTVLFFLLALGVFANDAHSKELVSRLGLGFRNNFAIDVPSVAFNYYPNADYGLNGALGIDTEDSNSRFALQGGIRRILFKEESLNFFFGGSLALINREVAGTKDSGFELGTGLGCEFFLSGLENLGFNIETGVSVTNIKKVRFRTYGASFIQAGIFFYF